MEPHTVPSSFSTFAGHVADAPVHTACVSHAIGVGPHAVPASFSGFAGHVADAPVHVA